MGIESPESSSLKRRTVISAAAWAAPVIAVAVATPAAAASTTEPDPSENPTSVQVSTDSSLSAESWASATVTGRDGSVFPPVDAILPANTVITITAPEGITIDVNEAARVNVGTISGVGTNEVIITPSPGVTTVSYYYTLSAPGTATTSVSGDVTGSTNGVFV